MTAETATEATTTNKRPRPSANHPLPTEAAYFYRRRCMGSFAFASGRAFGTIDGLCEGDT